MVAEAGAASKGPALILARYADFQEWNYETKLLSGCSEEDIKDYPTKELLDAMKSWVGMGEPLS
ncbi:hypothetical protein E6C72_08145 [Azospirillum sp. TSH100]|nr:hypothetical protein E6C72_08145 [Azospirillum sp. TSH100]